ncbi:acetyltransferase [Arthrobacter phage Peas]|uniref:Acetyltransferase n=1 Tax=Arthrobacter phage Peas TaxID=2419965 RepID=A0A3G2KIB3_9CAUD|nr:acetyltransferase [Arthrobacter phage Peas]AYN58718.1 acetyltransferase [Arthrobacter phage Peas]
MRKGAPRVLTACGAPSAIPVSWGIWYCVFETTSRPCECYPRQVGNKQTFINSFVMSHAVPTGVRSKLLRRLGVDLGPDTYLGAGTILKGTRLTTGKGCFINHGGLIDSGQVTLGDGVFVGPGVIMVSRDHELGPAAKRAGANYDKPITVGNGAWIGARATVLGGVHIAEGCVIGAGAVVTQDTLPNALYAGVPAVFKRFLA